MILYTITQFARKYYIFFKILCRFAFFSQDTPYMYAC